MRRICVVIGSRANYSSIKSAMAAIKEHPELDLKVVAMASALLDRYGSVVELIEEDGFQIDARVYSLIEGETPVTMAKSTGVGLTELATVFDRLSPDVVISVGDRFETMSTALAAAYMNIGLAHTMGGEVTGTIDESIRHAVTKFAHIHFPACEDAADRIIRLGEPLESVHTVGCPRIDLVAQTLEQGEGIDYKELFNEGVGGPVDLDKPFIMLSQHPVTTEYGGGERRITNSLQAIYETGLPAIILWPNADAGSEDIARGIRKFRENHHDLPFHFFKNLPVDVYIHLMSKTACLVGNSSSAIREGAFIGTPAVNIGSRQNRRQRGSNVIDVTNDKDAISSAIQKQLSNGRYPREEIYGDGQAGKKIAEVLAVHEWQVQKTITY